MIDKVLSQLRDIQSNIDTEFRVWLPVVNDLISNFQDRISDRNHTEIFSLLPSIYLSPDFNIEQSSAKLYELFKTEFNLATPFIIFRSKVKRRLEHCQYIIKPVDEQKQKLIVD